MNLSQLTITPDNVQQLSRQFGISTQDASMALASLLPAFSTGLKRNTQSVEGAAALIQALASGRHNQYAADAAMAVSNAGMQDGQAILGHLFKNKDVSRGVAQQAALTSGLGGSLIKKMLPVIASMVMGSLFKGAMGARSSSSGGLGGILSDVLGGALGGGFGGGAQPRSGGGLGGALGQAAGGGILGQIIEGLAGGALSGANQGTRRRAPRRRTRQSGDGLEDLLGQILGGGGTPRRQRRMRPTNDPVMPAPRRQTRRQTQRRAPAPQSGSGGLFDMLLGGGSGSGNSGGYAPRPTPTRTNRRTSSRRGGGLGDIFGDMLESGNQMGADYDRATGDVFDQLLGPSR